jgi:subtilisin-like proprotein convertase family protein
MKSKRVIRVALALSFWLAAVSAKADSFTATVLKDIPASGTNGVYGTPLVVGFNVTNFQNSVQSVSLTISMYHQYLGGLDVQLTSPGGTSFIIFSQAGPDINGDGSGNPDILGTADGFGGYNYGTYTFADSATYTLRSWSVVNYGTNSATNPGGDAYPVYSGSYRPSSVGPGNDVATTFAANSGFIGLPAAQVNGTWTLTFRDRSAGKFGNVQSAMLVLVQGSSPQPPRFTGIVVTNGVVTLSLTGPTSQGYRLYTATNSASPLTWSTNGTGTFDASGKATYSTSAVSPNCFYRVSSP